MKTIPSPPPILFQKDIGYGKISNRLITDIVGFLFLFVFKLNFYDLSFLNDNFLFRSDPHGYFLWSLLLCVRMTLSCSFISMQAKLMLFQNKLHFQND